MSDRSTIVTIEGFHARKLNNERRIFVYLPPHYEGDATKRYPVLYMHAGQRAFAPTHEGTEAWNVHLAADRLIAEGRMEAIIIVAIAHVRPVTSNEYYHFVAPAAEAKTIRCSGLDYEDFIKHDLKPYIDERFRTLRDPGNTALAGSSAGGLSTYHIGFRNPDVFGKLLLLSPYFVKAELNGEAENGLNEEKLYQPFEGKPPLKVWMDIGDAEGLFLARHVREVTDRLLANGFREGMDLAYLLQPEGAHQEADWGARIHIPLLYMFGKPGRPVSLELLGRDEIGMTGMQVQINALLRYDNGFAASVLNGTYLVADPEVLEVRPDGTLIPKRIGTTTVTLLAEGLEASRAYNVVAEVSEQVNVCLSVEVPSEGQPDAYIHGGMGMRLSYAGGNRYAGCFRVPRDTGYRFRFTRGFRKFESDAKGHRLPNRAFRAAHDLVLHYKVARWEDTAPDAPDRRIYAGPTF